MLFRSEGEEEEEEEEEVYVELPAEDAEEGMCGLLRKSMHGTRDAAQKWVILLQIFIVYMNKHI